MQIIVLCSHCESRLTLQEDLLGKQMRCPVCREVFTVELAPLTDPHDAPAIEEPPPANNKSGAARTDPPPAKYSSGSISDFLQILQTESALPAPSMTPRLAPEVPHKNLDEIFTDFEIVEEEASAAQKGAPLAARETAPTPKEAVPPAPEVTIKELPSVITLPEVQDTTTPAKEEPLVLEAVSPAPKEFVWSEDVMPPRQDRPDDDFAKVELDEDVHVEEIHEESTDDEPRPRHRYRNRDQVVKPRKKRSRLAMLIFLFLFVFGGLGTGGYFLKRYLDAAPERLYSQAKKEYEAGNYEPARKLFEEFIKEHPKDQRLPEARFFMELSSLRTTVYSVAVRNNPAPAQEQLLKFLQFIEEPAIKPLAAPGKYGVDIWQTALKLTEDLNSKATEVFRKDDPTESEALLEQAAALGPVVDRFRPTELTRETVFKQMDLLRNKLAIVRSNLKMLARVSDILINADDTKIDEARRLVSEHDQNNLDGAPSEADRTEARKNALASDPAFLALVSDANRKIADRVVYKRLETPLPPSRERDNDGTGLLFVSRLDAPEPRHVTPGAASTFFAMARGVLYVLDQNSGRVVWATRTGIDADTLPLRIPATDLRPELVLVVFNDGARSSLTARLAANGDTFWHQNLPSACLGQPILVGQRLFVPLRDPPSPKDERRLRDDVGVVIEIELSTGFVIGRISLGRPMGSGAARRPGTGHIYFPAEASGVYVFDTDRIGPDGGRLDPAFLGILPTNHAAGTLRGGPIITSDDGESSSYLILNFADGLDAMRLQAYPLAAADKPPGIVGQLPAAIPLLGWTWFPPYCDTEKLAVVTDRGEFGLFGVKQSGNLDVPIFVLPTDGFTTSDIQTPTRGQIVHVDEESFWFMAKGSLQHLRVGFLPESGLKLVSTGTPIPLGEPLQAAQVNARAATAMVVTQATASGSVRATAINLQTGAIRWQRQLGLIAQADPIRIDDSIILMDQDGGIYQMDAKLLASATNAGWLVDERWLVAAPFTRVVGASHFVAAQDLKSVYDLVTTQAELGLSLAIRHYTPGRSIEEKFVSLPSPISGNPIVSDKSIILPLGNGLLYRYTLGADKQLEAGPTWRGERINPQSTCHLTLLENGEYLVSNGARTINRWRWPNDQDEFSKIGAATLGEKIAAPPLISSVKGMTRMIVADIKSNVTMWDVDHLSADAHPVRFWRPLQNGPIPIGPLTGGPFLEHDAKGDSRICYVIDRSNIVLLSPEQDQPLWVSKKQMRGKGDGVVGRPQVRGGKLFVTDRSGTLLALDFQTGALVGDGAKLQRSLSPSTASIPLADTKSLTPLADGTLILESIGAPGEKKLPFLLFPLPPHGVPVPIFID